ncbi:MAG: hypothetical protein ACTSW7_01495 [Candidatus Thorarchaeota archaeon]|nr:hypothetical protein [Thermoplasmatales archaeon]
MEDKKMSLEEFKKSLIVYRIFGEELDRIGRNQPPPVFLDMKRLSPRKEKRKRMLPIEAEGRKFEVEFRHEINFIQHPRPKKNKDGSLEDPYIKGHKRIAKGGKTFCALQLFEKERDALELDLEAVAECSKKDMYNRAIGREIAFGRAVRKFEQYMTNEVTTELHAKFRELPEDMNKEEAKAARNEIIQEISKRVNEVKSICKTIKKEFAKRKNGK